MSNLILNIRFWYWHVQIERDFPYGPYIRFNWFLWNNTRRFHQRGIKRIEWLR